MNHDTVEVNAVQSNPDINASNSIEEIIVGNDNGNS